MDIQPVIVQLFQTPTCIIIALTILVFTCSFVCKDLHISSKDGGIEITVNSKKKKKKHKK